MYGEPENPYEVTLKATANLRKNYCIGIVTGTLWTKKSLDAHIG